MIPFVARASSVVQASPAETSFEAAADMAPIHNAPSESLTENDSLVRRLQGRARFLRTRGEIKSPDLMEQAARELAARSECK